MPSQNLTTIKQRLAEKHPHWSKILPDEDTAKILRRHLKKGKKREFLTCLEDIEAFIKFACTSANLKLEGEREKFKQREKLKRSGNAFNPDINAIVQATCQDLFHNGQYTVVYRFLERLCTSKKSGFSVIKPKIEELTSRINQPDSALYDLECEFSTITPVLQNDLKNVLKRGDNTIPSSLSTIIVYLTKTCDNARQESKPSIQHQYALATLSKIRGKMITEINHLLTKSRSGQTALNKLASTLFEQYEKIRGYLTVYDPHIENTQPKLLRAITTAQGIAKTLMRINTQHLNANMVANMQPIVGLKQNINKFMQQILDSLLAIQKFISAEREKINEEMTRSKGILDQLAKGLGCLQKKDKNVDTLSYTCMEITHALRHKDHNVCSGSDRKATQTIDPAEQVLKQLRQAFPLAQQLNLRSVSVSPVAAALNDFDQLIRNAIFAFLEEKTNRDRDAASAPHAIVHSQSVPDMGQLAIVPKPHADDPESLFKQYIAELRTTFSKKPKPLTLRRLKTGIVKMLTPRSSRSTKEKKDSASYWGSGRGRATSQGSNSTARTAPTVNLDSMHSRHMSQGSRGSRGSHGNPRHRRTRRLTPIIDKVEFDTSQHADADKQPEIGSQASPPKERRQLTVKIYDDEEKHGKRPSQRHRKQTSSGLTKPLVIQRNERRVIADLHQALEKRRQKTETGSIDTQEKSTHARFDSLTTEIDTSLRPGF